MASHLREPLEANCHFFHACLKSTWHAFGNKQWFASDKCHQQNPNCILMLRNCIRQHANWKLYSSRGFSQGSLTWMEMCKILSIRRSTEVGKSSLLTALTGVQSEAAAYEFTTLTCIPGWNIYGGISSRIEIKQLVLYGHAMPCLRLRYTAFPKSAKYLHHSLYLFMHYVSSLDL